MCKWKKTKGLDQQTDLKTEYPYYSCLHEVTFIKSPFECIGSNSNLVHQQNTIKQLFKLHSSKFTLLLFQHNFWRVKSWKSGVIRSFHMKFRKKSGIAQNQEKSGIIRKIRKCLTDWIREGYMIGATVIVWYSGIASKFSYWSAFLGIWYISNF